MSILAFSIQLLNSPENVRLLDNLGKNWQESLINILFCGYTHDDWKPTKPTVSRTVLSPGRCAC